MFDDPATDGDMPIPVRIAKRYRLTRTIEADNDDIKIAGSIRRDRAQPELTTGVAVACSEAVAIGACHFLGIIPAPGIIGENHRARQPAQVA
jgi:hypothetical protein